MWVLAKMHALCADSMTHEIIKHLGMGHMLGETFAIAHNNTYYYKPWLRPEQKGNSNIGKILAPHFVNLIAINAFARVTLADPIMSSISFFMGVKGEDFVPMTANWYSHISSKRIWDNVGFKQELASRGFDVGFKNQELYRLIRDGQLLNSVIEDYVKEVIYAQFKDDSEISNDKLLRDFFREISDPAYGNI